MHTLRCLAPASIALLLAGCSHRQIATPHHSIPPPTLTTRVPNPDLPHFNEVLRMKDAMNLAETVGLQLPINASSLQRVKDARVILAHASAEFEKADHPDRFRSMDQKVRDGLAHEDAAFAVIQHHLASRSRHGQAQWEAADAQFKASRALFKSVTDEIHSRTH